MDIASAKLREFDVSDAVLRNGGAVALMPHGGGHNGGHELRQSFIEFGPFRLYVTERLLLIMGQPVVLGSRAMDILILLTSRAGEVVTKQQLVEHVWPDTSVEESSLRVHVAKLRKALDEGQGDARYVANIAGRGYCFVASVTRNEVSTTAIATASSEARHARELPRRLRELYGREQDILAVQALVDERRFVTLHGPGGVGKTALAVTVASRIAPSFRDGVSFMDLSTQAESLEASIARALGMTLDPNAPLSCIAERLRDRQMLIVLDCCEHLVDSIAVLSELLYRDAPGIALLATSREPLNADGEYVYWLQPLATPLEGVDLRVQELVGFASVQLFLDRVLAGGQSLELGLDEAEIVGDICRRLDGNPLSLEFAAACVRAHGLAGTARLVNSSRNLQWQARRTACTRHRTLYSAIAWSYDLLAPREQALLRNLEGFRCEFDIEEALAVADSRRIAGRDDLVELMGQLVAKSLVMTVAGEIIRYRLLGTTRAFLRAKRVELGEAEVAELSDA